MFQTALIFFFCGISLFFPLFFWTYITSTFSQYRLKRIHFLVGIFLGALVMSMVGVSPYIPYGLGISSVLTSLSLITNISALGGYVLKLSVLCSLTMVLFMVTSSFFQNSAKIFVIRYFWAGIFFLQGIIFCAILMSFFAQLFPQNMGESQVIFSGVTFGSLGLIVGYYITLALFEEVGKYSATLTFGGKQETMTLGGTLLIATLVALGFSLFENAIYSYFYFERVGISSDLLRFILFRSIFSTTLHVLASLLLSYGLWYVIGQKISFSRVYLFLFLAFGLHSIFNIMLGFGHVFFLMIPLFGAYVFLSFLSESFTLKHQEIGEGTMSFR